MNEPRIIDHDPDEPPPDRSWKGLPAAFTFAICLIWIGNLVFFDLDWYSILLGALTGGGFIILMIEYTGNKVPNWMRR